MREPFIDADDIADVAVAALLEDGHEGELYELTGPRLLTFAEAVARRPRRAADRPHGRVHRRAARPSGSARPRSPSWTYLFGEVLDGRNASVADGVPRILGRAPRDVAEMAR